LHTDVTLLNNLIEQNALEEADFANKIAVNVMEFNRELAELGQQSNRLES